MAKLYSYRPSLSLNRDKNTCLKRHVSTGIADADAGTRAHLVQYMKLIIQTDNSFSFLSKECVTNPGPAELGGQVGNCHLKF